MRSLIPTLHVTRPATSTGLAPKLGGLPWGLSTSLWPVCKECGQAMSLVAQLPVRDALDQLGPLAGQSELSDLVLHLFKCEGEDVCSFWNPDIGTNAAFFLSRNDLREGYTAAPESTTEILPELWVTGWKPFEDPVPPELAEAVNDPIRWLNDFTDDMLFPATHRTKLGGVPWWTGNGPQQVPNAPFAYLLQIDQFLEVEDAEHDVSFGNFCSDGTCYVFVDAESLRATMFINR
ncbi:DUF1963 domain-containing protein [Pigmentiphaga aceris]|uniref:DUF1963 domain-containing protein n=1 Tax=Pigmentiphaga aceris TaxID=1940612 RepID=A0A5C0AUU4_9BURK|nr:DUF1963 domain-containing protein [Pigmentiphaga aceris]QEI06192.1 DUF1963 domain-containing protein [Pigmentiphaga aceris]